MATDTTGTAAEKTPGQERDNTVRSGDPIAVPEGPLCRWFLDRTEEHSDLPVAHVKRGAPSAPEGTSGDGEFVSITYAELLEDAKEVAGGLLELADPGDRIAISAETRLEPHGHNYPLNHPRERVGDQQEGNEAVAVYP